MPETEDLIIEVICPIPSCGKTSTVKVPNYLFDNKKMGTLKIQVHQGICCEHEFIAFISKAGKVRGYELIDMAIDLSKVEKSHESEQLYLRDLLKKYGDYAISSCLHALLLAQPIFLLRTKYEESKASEITSLFNSFLPDKFREPMVMVSCILEMEYKKAKIEDSLVVSPTGLIAHTPWSDIALTVEADIISNALSILDDHSQPMVIQQELSKILDQADFIHEYIKSGDIFEDDLADKLSSQFDEEFDEYRMKLLKSIVEHRFHGNLKRIKIRSFSKLKEGLW